MGNDCGQATDLFVVGNQVDFAANGRQGDHGGQCLAEVALPFDRQVGPAGQAGPCCQSNGSLARLARRANAQRIQGESRVGAAARLLDLQVGQV